MSGHRHHHDAESEDPVEPHTHQERRRNFPNVILGLSSSSSGLSSSSSAFVVILGSTEDPPLAPCRL